jgi:hypothetical protein
MENTGGAKTLYAFFPSFTAIKPLWLRITTPRIAAGTVRMDARLQLRSKGMVGSDWAFWRLRAGRRGLPLKA